MYSALKQISLYDGNHHCYDNVYTPVGALLCVCLYETVSVFTYVFHKYSVDYSPHTLNTLTDHCSFTVAAKKLLYSSPFWM